MTLGPLELAALMAEMFDRLEIPYVLGGSLASPLVGEPRSTVDIDMAIRLEAGDIERIIDAAEGLFYVPESAAA